MRMWNVEEQTVEVEGTKWLIEFTSAHTEALAAGEAAPDHDQHLVLRVWNETRNRAMILEFDRFGMCKRSDVQAMEPASAPDWSSLKTDRGIGGTGHDGPTTIAENTPMTMTPSAPDHHPQYQHGIAGMGYDNQDGTADHRPGLVDPAIF